MFKKFVLISLVCFVFAVFSTTNDSNGIENSQIVQFVKVQNNGKNNTYSFYLINDNKDKITLKSDNFKSACNELSLHYCNNLVLSKIELIMFDRTMDYNKIKNDITITAKDYRVSPLTQTAVCESKTLSKFEKANYEKIIDIITARNAELKAEKSNIITNYNKNSLYQRQKTTMIYINLDNSIKLIKI